AVKVCPFARRKHTERIEPDKECLATQRFEFRGPTSGRPLKQFSVLQVDLGERVSGRHANMLPLAMALLIGPPNTRLKALSPCTLPYIAWNEPNSPRVLSQRILSLGVTHHVSRCPRQLWYEQDMPAIPSPCRSTRTRHEQGSGCQDCGPLAAGIL